MFCKDKCCSSAVKGGAGTSPPFHMHFQMWKYDQTDRRVSICVLLEGPEVYRTRFCSLIPHTQPHINTLHAAYPALIHACRHAQTFTRAARWTAGPHAFITLVQQQISCRRVEGENAKDALQKCKDLLECVAFVVVLSNARNEISVQLSSTVWIYRHPEQSRRCIFTVRHPRLGSARYVSSLMCRVSI